MLSMADKNEDETCALCKRGTLVREERELAIRQFTDKGFVQCRVSVPIAVCGNCASQTLLDGAEELIENAIAAEYAKLP